MCASRRAHVALLFVLAVLGAMSVLSVAFFRLTALEETASASHALACQASLLADGGIEYALGRLDAEFRVRPARTARDASVYPAGPGTPLEAASGVSFQAGVAQGFPYSLAFAPGPGLESRLASGGYHAALAVEGLASLIDVRRLDADRPAGTPQGSTRLLDNLGRRLAADGRFRVLDGRVGSDLLARQPSGGYERPDQVEEALGAARGPSAELEADLALLVRFLSFHGWRDPRAVRPDGTGGLEISPACPIDVNTASREVLFALFAGVSIRWPDATGATRTHVVDDATALALADRILLERASWWPADKGTGDGTRDPYFADAEDLAAFLIEVAGPTEGVLAVPDVVALLAMLDPNARAGDPDPDIVRRYLSSEGDRRFGHVRPADRTEARRIRADKRHLAQWTTEACFDARGRYRIESLGRIVAADGRIEAGATRTAVVRLHEPAVWTSQADLEALLAAPGAERRFVRTDPAAAAPFDPADGALALGAPAVAAPPARLAALRAGDLAASLPDGHVLDPAPWAPPSAPRRASDGFHTPPGQASGVLACSSTYLPVEEGSVEFWVKFEEEGLRGEGTLLWAVNDLPDGPGPPAPGEDAGIDTLVRYRFDPVARTGRLSIERTRFRFAGDVFAPAAVAGTKREYAGKLRADAWDRLVARGRELVQSAIDQARKKWVKKTADDFSATFADWYAKEMLNALVNGATGTIVIDHAVVEAIGGHPRLDAVRSTSDAVDAAVPLVFESVEVRDRPWAARPHETVAVRTDRVVVDSQSLPTPPARQGNDPNAWYLDVVAPPGVRRYQLLMAAFDGVHRKGLEAPWRDSRTELSRIVYRESAAGVPAPSSWKAGEWHHVQVGWRETGLVEAYVDGLGAFDVAERWGPLTVFASRMTAVRDRLYLGPAILDLASDDAGVSPAPPVGRFLAATLERLVAGDRVPDGVPEGARFLATPPPADLADLSGASCARLALPLRSTYGNLLDRSRGAWIGWTAREPADPAGDPFVKVRLFVDAGGGWAEVERLDDRIGSALRSALFETPIPDDLPLLVLFEATGTLPENSSGALDQTPYLDDLSVTLLVVPDVLDWSTGG